MADKDSFISKDDQIKLDRLKTLYEDLKNARSARGWSNGSFTMPQSQDDIDDETFNSLRNFSKYNNSAPRYVNNFPAYFAKEGSDIRANFFNELQLITNDILNLVGCSQGCTAICVGCSNLCSGATCGGKCGTDCTGHCGSGCTGGTCASNCDTNACTSGCTGTCSGVSCAGKCASGCTGCKAACKIGTK